MMSVAALVDQALKAGAIPIEGVSIGNPANRATWKVHFKGDVTEAQKASAQQVIDTVPVDMAAQTEADAATQVDDRLIKAIITVLAKQFNRPPGQVRKELMDAFKAG